jgi:hypothetical protein
LAVKEEGEEVDVHLITDNGDTSKLEMQQHFDDLQDSLLNVDINFTYEIASKKALPCTKHYHGHRMENLTRQGTRYIPKIRYRSSLNRISEPRSTVLQRLRDHIY